MFVAITGGPGTGKSVIAKEFARQGAIVIDADRTAHRLLWRGTPTASAIIREFGNKITGSKGEINRHKLAAVVFSDNASLKTLNRIVHPVLVARIKSKIESFRYSKKIIVLDIALLFEIGLDRDVDFIVTADVPVKTQRERLKMESGLTNRRIDVLIKSQLAQELKKDRADFVISGCLSAKKLQVQVGDIIKKVKKQLSLRGA